MDGKGFFKSLRNFFRIHLYNPKWRCLSCKTEIFSGKYFCEECESKLPLIDTYYCEHCGRKLKVASSYCLSCKNKMTKIDRARSYYDYQKPINTLIMQLKYYGNMYLADVFAQDLANLYFKNYFNADLICCVPMSKKGMRKRGFNQSELLARALSEIVGVPVEVVLIKIKETANQAKLSREERLKNLKGAFRVTCKEKIKDKRVLIVDDVLTTGATSETIAEMLKNKGAKQVFLLTVASVSNKDGY